MSELLPQDRPTFSQGLRQAQTRAALAVRLYWQIGRNLERTRAFYQAYPDGAYSGLERTRQVGIYAQRKRYRKGPDREAA